MLNRLHVLSLAFMLAFAPAASFASQNALLSPTTGTASGLQLTNNYNSALDSVNTCNSGGSAPTNQLSGSASLGNCWWNTSTNALGYNDGSANWPVLGWFDTANHYWQGLTGGGAVNNIVSAGTTDLCSQKPMTVNVTGTTTITSFGSNCQVGQVKHVIFTGALTLTHNAASLILPNAGSNVITAAGDVAEATYLGSGNWRVTDYVLINGQPLNTSAVAVGAASLTSAAQGFNAALNLRLSASVASNALTVSILGTNGSNPSSVNPVLIGFRDSTLATGDMIVDSLQSALSFTVNSGNTMGASNTVPFRLWIFAFDNSGTVALALINCSATTAIYQCAEDQLQSTQAGTSGGSTSGLFYANASALSGKAVRILGYLEYSSGLTTAGTWNAAPTKIQLFGPGVKKPGETVQTIMATTQSQSTASAASYTSSNITASISLSSSPNLVRIKSSGGVSISASTSSAAVQMFRASTALGTASAFFNGTASSNGITFATDDFDLPGTTASTTYTLKYASDATHTITVPSVSGFPGGAGARIELEEIMGALEPANDNGPMSMVG